MPPSEDDTGSLEKARKRLYDIQGPAPVRPLRPSPPRQESVPHAWQAPPSNTVPPHVGKRHLRLATIFLGGALGFFVIALGVAALFFYYGGNSVSVDKITFNMQGPTTIAAGDTVPLSLTITNKNPVALQNATIEVDFPSGTLAPNGSSTSPDPRYTEDIGTIASGGTATVSMSAIIFGEQGQALVMPITLTYGTSGSSTTFVKTSSYSLAVSSTPLSVSVSSASQAIAGQPLSFTLTVRSNATLPLQNVVVVNTLPFGFTETSASMPFTNSSFYLGTLTPGAVKTVTLTGTLTGQNGDQSVFHFGVGTAVSATDPTLALTYMTQAVPITITAPFISTTLALNGDSDQNLVITPGTNQSVVLNYINTLATSVTNASISVTLSGSSVDYNSIQTQSGFYDSATHSIIFSNNTDPSLAQMAPGASGVGAFTFSTLPSNANILGPTVTFTISVSGTSMGETNVPQTINASQTETVKVASVAALTASSLHSSGPFANSGPIPPVPGQPTTYTIEWNVVNSGNPLAGGTVSATLPSYVTYTGKTGGMDSFSYDDTSGTISWNVGDLAQGASATGSFQVSLTPSTSQISSVPALTSVANFSGYDRFAGVQVTASANPATTQTSGDPGYVTSDAAVQ
jgi:uncharacterized repeat protein (TIGR01451 family)